MTFKIRPIRESHTEGLHAELDNANYLYDGSNAVEDLDRSGTLLSRYAETQNIDEPLAEQRSGTTNYYEADPLGSVTSLTNGAAAIRQHLHV